MFARQVPQPANGGFIRIDSGALEPAKSAIAGPTPIQVSPSCSSGSKHAQENLMVPKLWACGTTGALALAAVVGTAQSAPLGSAVDRFGSATATESNLERVQYRLCVTEGGSRQCRSVKIYGPGQTRFPSSRSRLSSAWSRVRLSGAGSHVRLSGTWSRVRLRASRSRVRLSSRLR